MASCYGAEQGEPPAASAESRTSFTSLFGRFFNLIVLIGLKMILKRCFHLGSNKHRERGFFPAHLRSLAVQERFARSFMRTGVAQFMDLRKGVRRCRAEKTKNDSVRLQNRHPGLRSFIIVVRQPKLARSASENRFSRMIQMQSGMSKTLLMEEPLQCLPLKLAFGADNCAKPTGRKETPCLG